MKTKYPKTRTKKTARVKPKQATGESTEDATPETKHKHTLGDYFLLPHLHKGNAK